MSKKQATALQLAAAFAAVYIVWGSTYLAIRFSIETLPPFLMAATRFIVAGFILFAFTYPKSEEKITFQHLKSTAIIGLCLLLGGNGGVVWAELYVPSGLTALLVSTVPVWVVIITWFFPHEHRNQTKNVIGVLLGFTGLFFLVSPESIISGSGVDLTATLVLLAATLSWSAGSVYTGRAVLPQTGLLATSLEMIFGGIGLLLLSTVTGELANFDPSSVSMKSFLAFLYLIGFGSLIGFTAYIWLLHHTTPSKATTYAYVNPVVAVFLGWLIAGEEITLKIIVAAAIIITAVIIIITDFSALIKKRFPVKVINE